MILIIQFTRVMTTTRNKTRKDGDNDEDTKFNLTTAGGVNRAGVDTLDDDELPATKS